MIHVTIEESTEAERLHHKYGMSKLNALDACAGYQNNDTTSDAADDGKRLHDVMEQVIKQVLLRIQQGQVGSAIGELITLSERGMPVDENEMSLLAMCCEELDLWLKKGPIQVCSEIRVTLRHPNGQELNHGHLDVFLMFEAGHGVLIDYKFGWIPVPDAPLNIQGTGYAAALLQENGQLQTVRAIFIQPKLNKRTERVYLRSELYEMYERVRGVIARVEAPDKTLRPNPYCDFCGVAGTCSALVRSAHAAVIKYEGIPLPDIFNGEQITTPEQAMVAMYMQQRLEALFNQAGIKKKVLEFAQASGGHLEYRLSNDQVLVVELGHRKKPRSVHSPALVTEAIAQHVGQESAANVVLGACDVRITDLEDRFADQLVEQRKQEAASMPRAVAKQHRVTKKAAKEILASILRAEGLLTSGNGLLTFPKLKLEKCLPTQLLTEGTGPVDETKTKD